MPKCKKAIPIVLVALLACGPSAEPSPGSAAGDEAAELSWTPSASLTADPSAILAGQSSKLVATFHPGLGFITPHVGFVRSGVPVTVRPTETTTYTLTVWFWGRIVRRSVQVIVRTPSVPVAVTVSPPSATVVAGGTQVFTAAVANAADPAVSWSVQESGGGTIDAGGTYVAPKAAGTYHVIATSVADPAQSGSATVTVTEAPEIQSFSATPSSIAAGATATLSATYSGGTGTIDQGVGPIASGGSVSVAPATTTTYTLSVSDGAGHAVAQSLTVTVVPPLPPLITVAVSPTTATVPAGGTQVFTATVANTTDTRVIWSVLEPGGGTIDASGTYVAPATAGTYHVAAVSVADPTRSGVATVTVTPPPPAIQGFTAAPASITAGASATLSATYSGGTGTIDQGVGAIASGGSVSVTPAATTTYTLTVSDGAGNNVTRSVTVTVTAPPPIAVAVSPATATVLAGGTRTFTATVSNSSDTRVTWSVQESGGGTIDAAGVYIAPAAAGTYHVVATSVADPTKSGRATVTVTLPPAIQSFTAAPSSITAGASSTLSATYSGGTGAIDQGVGAIASGGSVSVTPAATTTYTLTVSDGAGNNVTRSVTVTVTAPPPISVAVSPATATVLAGGTQTFTATVSNSSDTRVTWSVQESGGGTVDPGGVYIAPAAAGTYHVVATSVADPTKSGSATVRVTSIAVAISPKTATTISAGILTFTATVSGTAPGQSTGVTWSVQEAGGGTVDSTGRYTAPMASGTFHVVAASVADPSKTDSATVTVTSPVIAVLVSPRVTQTSPGGAVSFTATVTGAGAGQSTEVTWLIQEGALGGSIDANGSYTAPSVEGTYHVVATAVADPSKSDTATVTVTTFGFIPADRLTTWSPGVAGGIPARTTVCATVNASTWGNGASDATAGIQAAIDACPAGQVVQLSAGTFTINGGRFLLINKGITLRGAGPGQTTLQKTDGAKPGQEATGPNPSPLVIIGPARWANNSHGVSGSTNLTADAAKGATSITVASTAGFSAGQNVLLDELSGATWQADPAGRGQIWASPDWRVVWQRHNPSQGTDDPWPSANAWFSRADRPTNEVKQIDRISGNTVFFTTPIHISYRASQTAQLSRYEYAHVRDAGIEDLKLIGGDNGQIRFQWAANCWAKRIDNTVWHDEGFAIEDSFRIEIRDSYVHDAAWAQPGGAGYAISLASGSAEVLVENSIAVRANKVMVARSAGAGSVFGYNYVDDGYIVTNTNWIEVGLNASHMVGPHHVLFEGNYGFNWDSDKTHGSAIYHTVFRNHLRGVRSGFNDATHGPRRCAGAAYYSYWHTFVGNVLGAQGQMTGWTYQSGNMDVPSIWLLGWDDWSPYPTDPKVAMTILRHGNFDYLTNSVVWDPAISDHTLPPSLYRTQRPAFFDAGSGYVWPWVDPTGAQKLYNLPAKARYDAGTPFVQP